MSVITRSMASKNKIELNKGLTRHISDSTLSEYSDTSDMDTQFGDDITLYSDSDIYTTTESESA